jgi:hypothetical protein
MARREERGAAVRGVDVQPYVVLVAKRSDGLEIVE